MNNKAQLGIGAAALALAGVLVIGALPLRADSGYSGLGPAFLPSVVALMLALCGAMLVYEALSGGFRNLTDETDGIAGDLRGFAWVSAGLMLNAALITRLGFVISCALLYMLAARGFRGHTTSAQYAIDLAIGACLSAPVFWMFTKLLGVNLPSLTGTGWL